MSTVTIEQIIDEALQYPEKERAYIAATLISSLEQVADADVELAWQKEVAKRMADISSGRVKCISWEDVRIRLYQNASVQD